MRNVVVDVGATTGRTADFSVSLPLNTTQMVILARPASPGQPFMLPMIVVDGCGEWRTFVGAGAQAFPTPTATATATRTAPPPTIPPPSIITLDDLDGHAYLRSPDGTYLGDVSRSQVASNSVCNSVGRYGSAVSSTSVRNSVGRYGSSVSSLSAYNPVASQPPQVVYSGWKVSQPTVVAYLTKNPIRLPQLDPDRLFEAYGCD